MWSQKSGKKATVTVWSHTSGEKATMKVMTETQTSRVYDLCMDGYIAFSS